MQALLAQGYEGKIDLIYIDPPFDSKADYSYHLMVGGAEVTKEPSVLERLAYRDTWEAGRDSYLDMLYPRLQLMRRLLSERGSIFIHIGSNLSHFVRVLLDEVFGQPQFQNEIVWIRSDPHNDARKKLGNVTDRILWYGRSEKPYYDADIEREELSELAEEEFSLLETPDGKVVNWKGNEQLGGRRFKLENATWKGSRNRFEWRGCKPPAKREWMYTFPEMEAALARGELYLRDPSKGSTRCWKKYLDENKGIYLQDLWDGVGRMKGGSDYPTQKPTRLLERIINIACPPGGTVADFFAGSGTTALAAEFGNRRWLVPDFGKVGIQVARSKLVGNDAKPFLIENIGNYQREMIYLTGGRIGEMQRIILKLYGATPHPAYKDLGVRKADDGTSELVYVGYPDRPTTAKKVEELARLAESLDGSGYKRLVVLAWDYDYSYDEAWDARMKAAKKPLKVEVQKKLIPPDVYDYLKKAKTEADIEKLADKIVFHEKPYLKLAKPKVGKKAEGKREVTISIQRYVLFDLPVPDKDKEKLQQLVKENFAVLIDYWAVDWNYDGATFRSMSQAIRGNGKKAKVVPTELSEKLAAGRKQTVSVRVVDVFGNDAAATVEVEL
jgi:DNA modification methylase